MTPRPYYETEHNLNQEKEVVKIMSEEWRSHFYKLPISYHLDYALVRDNRMRGFAEIKCRTNRVDTYPTYMISLLKLIKANELSAETGLPCLLLVQWIDWLGWTTFDMDYELSYGGRKDRGDGSDVEPVAHFPIDIFTLVHKTNPDILHNVDNGNTHKEIQK